ncbi:hypothetical protein MES5069_620021 [Mesorhizobium escarrei]|uniref:Transposase IS701-like DDE domain-containing protein n=1 Tax=Mesorhizobium escarrei TaxID=666018 RepID=A0ABN8KBS3_9HYPH|nr:hypothetical protein MES5069_620021 [Mesorhizobium escarrei]
MNDERLNRVHAWAAGDLDRGVVVVVVDACFTDAATAAWLRQRNAATGGSESSSLTYRIGVPKYPAKLLYRFQEC